MDLYLRKDDLRGRAGDRPLPRRSPEHALAEYQLQQAVFEQQGRLTPTLLSTLNSQRWPVTVFPTLQAIQNAPGLDGSRRCLVLHARKGGLLGGERGELVLQVALLVQGRGLAEGWVAPVAVPLDGPGFWTEARAQSRVERFVREVPGWAVLSTHKTWTGAPRGIRLVPLPASRYATG